MADHSDVESSEAPGSCNMSDSSIDALSSSLPAVSRQTTFSTIATTPVEKPPSELVEQASTPHESSKESDVSAVKPAAPRADDTEARSAGNGSITRDEIYTGINVAKDERATRDDARSDRAASDKALEADYDSSSAKDAKDGTKKIHISHFELKTLMAMLPRDIPRERAIEAMKQCKGITDAYFNIRRQSDTMEELEKRSEIVSKGLQSKIQPYGYYLTQDMSDIIALVNSLKVTEQALRKFREEDDFIINEDESDDDDDGNQEKRDVLETKPKMIVKPETRVVSWEDWSDDAHAIGEHAAIEILEEAPAAKEQEAQKFSRKSRVPKKVVKSTQQDHATSQATAAALNKPELPEMLKIRSTCLRRMLVAMFHDDLAVPACKTCPVIFLRPYKLFVYADQELHDKFAEIKLAVQNKRQVLQELHLGWQQHCHNNTSTYPHLEQCLDTQGETTMESDETRDSAGESGDGVRSKPQEQGLVSPEAGPLSCWDEDIFTSSSPLETLNLHQLKEAEDHWAELIRFLDETLIPARTRLQKQPSSVYFSDMWHLFEPGNILYVRNKVIQQKAWRITHCTGGRKRLRGDDRYTLTSLAIDCFYLDFTGSGWKRIENRFLVEPFQGARSVGDLEYMPLPFAENGKLTSKSSLEAQGRQFIRSCGHPHQYYSGRTLDRSPIGDALHVPNTNDPGVTRLFSKSVESQVIVDFDRALQENPDWSPRAPDCDTLHQVADEKEVYHPDDLISDDRVWDTRLKNDFLEDAQFNDDLHKVEQGASKPSGDNLLILPERVFAYVLRSREWACLHCGEGSFREVEKRTDAWDDLRIPLEHKSIVQSLIEAHFNQAKSESNDFDLIRDKGKGVIVLLHGVPGVGKTSTAECVAESYKKPLLPITCGDLGLTAELVETRLNKSFQLAQAWGCVLLLDEADVFLAERTPADVERNALVSVFLRVLEYYEGILFLTTNRVGSFDEAFKSRIHMSLYYPPLNWKQTKEIWESQIKRAAERTPPVECGDELMQFAEHLFEDQSKAGPNTIGPVWNGRQIRNAFQSAVALARRGISSESIVKIEEHHFRKVADVSHAFNDYLFRVKHGQTDARQAHANFLRYDSYGGLGAMPQMAQTDLSVSTYARQTKTAAQAPQPQQPYQPMQHMGYPAANVMGPMGYGNPQAMYGQFAAAPTMGYGLPAMHGQQQTQQTAMQSQQQVQQYTAQGSNGQQSTSAFGTMSEQSTSLPNQSGTPNPAAQNHAMQYAPQQQSAQAGQFSQGMQPFQQNMSPYGSGQPLQVTAGSGA